MVATKKNKELRIEEIAREMLNYYEKEYDPTDIVYLNALY